MDYLQYPETLGRKKLVLEGGFKPYYKWITFNTMSLIEGTCEGIRGVLNLIINGLPSIQNHQLQVFHYFLF